MFKIVVSVKVCKMEHDPTLTLKYPDVTLLRHIAKAPFVLGEWYTAYVSIFDNIRFIIEEVETDEELFKWSDNGSITITNKETQICRPSSGNDKFNATFSTIVTLPPISIIIDKLFGLEDVEEDLLNYLSPKTSTNIICLYGPSGCGKVSLLQNIEKTIPNRRFIWLDLHKLLTHENYLSKVYDSLYDYGKDVIICIEDLDIIGYNKPIYDCLYTFFKEIKYKTNLVYKVIITCQDKAIINSSITSQSHVIFVRTLTNSEKIDFLKFLLPSNILDNIKDDGLELIVSCLRGYSTRDVKRFISQLLIIYPNLTLLQLKVENIRKIYQPFSLLNLVSDINDLKWSDIGGYEDVKTVLKEDIQEPIRKGKMKAKGILLYGPPGCSKTMFARALATECQMNLYVVRPSNIMDCLLGRSEAKLREIITQAKASAPSIIFIDEIDTIIPKREENGTSVSIRLLTEIVTFLDGVETKKDDNVLLLAATNKLENLDEALLRPGRMDLKILIDLPDHLSRESILRIVFSDKDYKVVDDIWGNISEISKKLINKSGADIVALGWKIKQRALRDLKKSGSGDKATLTMDHVSQVIIDL